MIGVIGPGCTCQFRSLQQKFSGALTLFSFTADIRKKFAANNVIDQIGRSFLLQTQTCKTTVGSMCR